jgi:hypothetical protein
MRTVEFRSVDDAVDGDPFIYGGPIFAERAASALGVSLLEPLDDWLVRLPERFRRRQIQLSTLSEAKQLPGRWFAKTPREKTFEPGVYSSAELPPGDADELLLVSDIVSFTQEYRLLVLEGRVYTASCYLPRRRSEPRRRARVRSGPSR